MHPDSIGIFWPNPPVLKKRGAATALRERPLPPIPDTGWKPPTEFPRLAGASRIAIDVETREPGNFQYGSDVRRDGYIAGLAVAVDDASWYFPMRHKIKDDDDPDNMDPEKVLAWARDELCRPNQPKVGANLLYDLDWLYQEGVPVTGPFLDVQLAEPLLDEAARSYSLDTLSLKHLQESKRDELLYAWCADAYGGNAGRPQAKNIYRAPARLVGPYAQGDVELPLRILDKQQVLLQQQGLTGVFDLETRLVPMLLAMRRRGVRVDVERAGILAEEIMQRCTGAQQALNEYAGFEVNVDAAADLGKLFDQLGIGYSLTGKSKQPSITKAFLQHLDHDVSKFIFELRRWQKVRGFVQGYILDHHVNGRIHAEFHQLRKDNDDGRGSNGTVSGRFSSSNPNLQNIPARDPEIGPLIRGLFLPEPGELWSKDDYSQVEYRLVAHYGWGPSAEATREAYATDPNTDFHAVVAKMIDIDRKTAKNINFGLLYGMGIAKLANDLGCSAVQAREYKARHQQMAPFAKDLADAARKRAKERGFVKTLLNRRRRFDLWELGWIDPIDKTNPRSVQEHADRPKFMPCGYEEAMARTAEYRKKYNRRLQRAYVHKALNSVIQGSAADVMKKAMVDIWEAGVCNDLGAPLLTVHDELDWSIPQTGAGRRAHAEAIRIMETCMKLRVPLVVDSGMGKDWGSVD